MRFPLQGFSKYKDVLQLQETLVSQFLASKKDGSYHLEPHVITTQFRPTYTTGRRDVGKLSQTEIEYLTAETPYGRAEYHAALRGGQTTYHGPGQLTAYPIIDLKQHGLTARCYVHLLEEVIIKTCARYDLKAFRTKDTGVWVSPDRKVGSIGVHMRRHITSHGIALNITDAVKPWFDRIVACGLADKRATSFQSEGWDAADLDHVDDVFIEELARTLPGIERIDCPQKPMFTISMPDEFVNLLPHMAIISDESMDDMSPVDQKAMDTDLNNVLKGIIATEIERSAAGPPGSGQILVTEFSRESGTFASKRVILNVGGKVDHLKTSPPSADF